MILLNIVYGLIIALMVLASLFIMGYGMAWHEFLAVWGVWTVGHIIYETVAFWLVKLFNRNKVYRG